MRRPMLFRFLAAGALALATLGTSAAPATATAAAPAGTTEVLSVQGAGPYRIGASRQSLAAAGLVSWVDERPGCPIVNAGATGDWAGVILLAFRDGRLAEVGTATVPPRSPAGASVGMTWTELEGIYGRRGALIHNTDGEPAYLVRKGSRVELFTGHPIRQGAGYFQVGPADFVLNNFLHGPAC
ncbi:hypothetical protein [Actinoplanes friuliensis]|nr:hypothetical protein [Actinoplanes friuliensis]